ncbi:MAG TPA: MerR family transcriptional regulator [Streptosporangiaceae bacterium]
MTAAVTRALRSGEVAEAAGVNPQTLRYYERRGLLPRPERSLGGHRLYPPDTVDLLRVIKAAQRLGFTLDEVADLLAAARGPHGRVRDRLDKRATAKLAEVEARIADLYIIRDRLRAVLASECASLTECTCNPDCPLPFTDLTALKEQSSAPARARS